MGRMRVMLARKSKRADLLKTRRAGVCLRVERKTECFCCTTMRASRRADAGMLSIVPPLTAFLS